MSLKKDFIWGAATASYQIEGAWNEDGKGANIWDEFSHINGKVDHNENGDKACDHYHNFKEDVKLMSELGLKAYRFSISWARVIPDGTGKVNEKGIQFYKDLVDELLKYNITPLVTLYHWDLPAALNLKGGWLNPEISTWFENYTKVVVEALGTKVQNFITLNEPSVFLGCGYWEGSHAPGYKLGVKDILQIAHNIHMAHGKAAIVLRNAIPDVKIGLALATQPKIPVTPADEQAAYDAYFFNGLAGGAFFWSVNYWMDPIMTGKYPEQLLKEAGDLFPKFTEEDMKIVGQKVDFIGLNIYEAQYQGNYVRAEGTAHTELNWDVYPDALKWGILHNYKRYQLPVIITENGLSAHDWVSLDGKVHDPNRIDFLNRYLKGLKEAAEMGCDVAGYFHWSFMDNFEWARGYNPRFGLVFVDYPTSKRIPKDSAYWYKSVIESNGENL